MSSLPAVVGAMFPVAATGRRRRRLWAVAAAVALAVAAAAAWYLADARRHAAEVAEARGAEIAAARARAIDAANANGVPVSDRAVEVTHAAAAANARPSRVADASLAASLFGTHSWYVPPPPPAYIAPPPPPPPPAPTAPPLPFVFLGSYTPAGDATVYFITRGDRVYDVKVGDAIDDSYQVESAAGGALVFLYKPLKQRQTMPTGATP